MLSCIVEGLAAPEAVEDVQTFIEETRPALQAHLLAYFIETGIVFRCAEAHRQHHTPVGEMVERDQFARQLPGPPPRDRGQHRPQAHALRARRHQRQQNPGIEPRTRRVRRRLNGDAIGNKDAVPASRLRLRRQRGNALDIAARNNETIAHANKSPLRSFSSSSLHHPHYKRGIMTSPVILDGDKILTRLVYLQSFLNWFTTG